jgi:hypothetical protein
MKMFENSTPTLFDGMELPSMSSAEVSHAKTSVTLESDLVLKVRGLVFGHTTGDF